MKVLIGQFITESNANVPSKNEITSYDIAFGDELIRKMQVGDIFEKEGIEIIPSIYAVSGASGVVKKHTFDYIEACFLNSVKEHLSEIDGMYLMLHGASEVEEIGSGDHHILMEIRKLVGPYLPITVACDPHGNLTKEYVEAATVIRSYRESPHSDEQNTWRLMAQLSCDLVKNRKNIHSVYRKLPMILGGEQSVSADEPVNTINKYMNELEKDPRILSCSWHVGYIRHDCDVAGCGIVVVPSDESNQNYAEEIADKLFDYVWNKRHEFHYTGQTAEPIRALKMALDFKLSPVVITDSGDNTTSGAGGWNTYILRQVLALKNLNKTVLFA
ncbi:MAG: M81 family metallopeptidase, partial [Lachnospiraceae bacterium]